MSQITSLDLDASLRPRNQITLSGAASRAMSAQGQFQALDDATPIIDTTTAALGAGEIRVRMKPASVRGAIDKQSLVRIYVNAASGNVACTATIGTLRFLSAATGDAYVVIEPEPATGKIDVIITLSAGAGTTAVVWAEHRHFSSKPETITSAT